MSSILVCKKYVLYFKLYVMGTLFWNWKAADFRESDIVLIVHRDKCNHSAELMFLNFIIYKMISSPKDELI